MQIKSNLRQPVKTCWLLSAGGAFAKLSVLLEGPLLNNALRLRIDRSPSPTAFVHSSPGVGSGEEGGRAPCGSASRPSSVQAVGNCCDIVSQARGIKETETGYSAEL